MTMDGDDKLDLLLRADAGQVISDAGFSARVLSALPPKRAPARSWLRPALVLGSAALGSVLAVAFVPPDAGIVQGYLDLVQLRGLTPAAISGLALCAATLLSAVVLAFSTD
jgi:hypothetical protein